MVFKNLLAAAVLLFGAAHAAPVDVKDCVHYEEYPEEPATGLYLEVVSLDGTTGPMLEDGSYLCPDDYSDGFSIVCKGFADGTESATFYVDGDKSRTERVVPYAIAGDINAKYRPFTAYSKTGPTEIKCMTDDGETVVANVDFSCEMPMESTPEAETEGEAMEPVTTPVTVTDPVVTEASTTTKMMTTAAPMTTKMMTTAAPMTTKMMTTAAPITTEAPAPAPKSSGGAPAHTVSGDCVSISALDASSEIPSKWVRRPKGLIYEPNGGPQIERPGGKYPVTYRVKAPADGFYAIEMDSTTPDKTEHNDIYMRVLDGGIALRKDGRREDPKPDWFKVYQNRADRAIEAKTVDHQGWSLYTGKSFKKGEIIEFEMSARSTRILVHGFYLFPCSGTDCEAKSDHWKGFTNDICKRLP